MDFAASHFPHADRPTMVLMAPAMGVPATFYEPFAARLRAAGIAVRLLEMPGQGNSPSSARRGDDYGYREIVEDLLPDAVGAARREFPQGRIVLAGHSLGGQLAVLASAGLASSLDGLVLVAAGTAHWRSWPAGRRLLPCVTVHAIAALAALLPWYPGDRVGFGGAQSRRLMRDWRYNACTGRYRLEGSARDAGALRSALREVRLPVLALSIHDDPVAPEGSLAELLAHLPAARVQRVTVTGHLSHAPWKRHFSWARQRADVEDVLLAWLAEDVRPHFSFSGVTDDHARDPDARDPAPVPAP